MSLNIIFIFLFSVSHTFSLNPITNSDGSKYYPVNNCSLIGSHCNYLLEKPCCDEKHECKVLDISTDENIYTCLNATIVGDTCRFMAECGPLENAICSYRKCRCLPNYGPSLNKTKCVLLLDGYCDEDQECYTQNSDCINNKCQCKENFVMNSMKECVRSSIGKSCNSNLKCGDLSHNNCVNGRCACKQNHILVNNAACLPLLGEFCWSDERCGPKNSICSNNKCQCDLNYNAVSNNECVLHQN